MLLYLLFIAFISSVSVQEDSLRQTARLLLEIASPYIRADRIHALEAEKCIPDLGCFRRDGIFYHVIYRPLTIVPEDREKIDTKFTFYSRKNLYSPQNVTANFKSISATNFDPTLKTIVVIHGFYFDNFFGGYQKDLFKSLRDIILLKENVNLIFVDWGRGASTWYLQATSNARVVGAEIALLIDTLIKYFGAKPEKFHLIGHSLGSHIAGYAGERIPRLGRITGLDPAKPYFDGMSLKVKLDPTDALFVDIIHTNAPMLSHPLGFGTREISGDLDYYPNNGNSQPGCLREKIEAFGRGFGEGLRESGVCNHGRSVEFIIESIENTQCPLFAWRCTNYEQFELGNCYKCGPKYEHCRIMGKFYPMPKIKPANLEGFYLMTRPMKPFCAYHFRAMVEIEEGGSDEFVIFGARIRGDGHIAEGHSRKMILNNSEKNGFILLSSEEIKKIETLEIAVESVADKIMKMRITITPMSYWSDSQKKDLTIVFCVEGPIGVKLNGVKCK